MSLGRKRRIGLQDKKLHKFAFLIFGLLALRLASCQELDSLSRPGVFSPEPLATKSIVTAFDSTSPVMEVETTIPTPEETLPKPKIIRIAVPEHLFSIVKKATRMAHLNQPQWRWIPLVSDQPEDLLEQGRAQVGVIPDGGGIFVGRTPLVLAVPFTMEWEDVTLQEVQSILTVGNDSVRILDLSQKPPNLRALKVDGYRPVDQDYPLQRDWYLIANEAYAQSASYLAPYIFDRLQEEPILHLAAVGDIMLDRALGRAIESGKTFYPFEKVANLLTQADLAIGNLESSLGEGGEAENKNYTFRAPVGAVDALRQAGFDVLSLANNHAMDYGEETMLSAITLLDENGIAAVGAGMNQAMAYSPVILDMQGLRLAFLAYVDVPVEGTGFDTRQWVADETDPGVAWAEPEQIRKDVSSARSFVDIVIVLLHSGYEYIPEPNEIQVAAAHAAIEAGAALVLGHHTHTLQPLEFYRGGVIAYGLGNFAFEQAGLPETVILNIWIDRSGVRELEVIPVLIRYDGQPVPAPEEQGDRIRAIIYSQTEFFASLQNK
jgi:poly-gamma-glutamate capsule biosynthesis protein CapA/YwtB (metallophosphatase superfamily)